MFFSADTYNKRESCEIAEQRLLRLFINKVNPELKAARKGARDLKFNDIELYGYFKNVKKYL